MTFPMMSRVRRPLAFAMLALIAPGPASGQALSMLRIKVVLIDSEQRATPVPRHALLISDIPASAAPRRIVTALDGTAEVRLRPGTYTVESDKPVAFHGQSYEWTQTVDVAAGRDTVLELTMGNAQAGPITSDAARLETPLENDPALLLRPWQDSIVALWTSTSRASGFAIDARGLLATSQRAVGNAEIVEVQLAPAVKIAGRVLIADRARDVAVIWIDPNALAAIKPVPLGCALPPRALVTGQDIFTIGSGPREPKALTAGVVRRVEGRQIVSDFELAESGAGAPVFAADGALVGITSPPDKNDEGRRHQPLEVVRIGDACDVVASAEQKMTGTAPPSGAHLPVEPARPVAADAAADNGGQRRAASLSSYVTSSSDFDLTFITPALLAGKRRSPVPALDDFGNWSEYVADAPPVLLIRATPKLVEGFWTTVARGAAMTQGMAIPSFKHFKSGFSRMRAFCGAREVTPIHPFTLEHRVSERGDVVGEGLYVYDPAALGPQCGTVKLELYAEKEPGNGQTRVIDPKVIQQVWQDFAPAR